MKQTTNCNIEGSHRKPRQVPIDRGLSFFLLENRSIENELPKRSVGLPSNMNGCLPDVHVFVAHPSASLQKPLRRIFTRSPSKYKHATTSSQPQMKGWEKRCVHLWPSKSSAQYVPSGICWNSKRPSAAPLRFTTIVYPWNMGSECCYACNHKALYTCRLALVRRRKQARRDRPRSPAAFESF